MRPAPALLLMLLAAACAHRIRLIPTPEKRVPIAGSERAAVSGDPVPRVTVDWSELDTKGRAIVEIELLRTGTREVSIEQWGQESYAAYAPLNFLIRYVALPFHVVGIVMPPVGLWCAQYGHDHDGDGGTDAGEKFADCIAYLNPFEGDPSQKQGRSREILRRRSRAREPYEEVAGPAAQVPFKVQLRGGALADQIELRAGDDGRRTVELAEMLPAGVRDDVRVEILLAAGGEGDARTVTAGAMSAWPRKGLVPAAAPVDW